MKNTEYCAKRNLLSEGVHVCAQDTGSDMYEGVRVCPYVGLYGHLSISELLSRDDSKRKYCIVSKTQK